MSSSGLKKSDSDGYQKFYNSLNNLRPYSERSQDYRDALLDTYKQGSPELQKLLQQCVDYAVAKDSKEKAVIREYLTAVFGKDPKIVINEMFSRADERYVTGFMNGVASVMKHLSYEVMTRVAKDAEKDPVFDDLLGRSATRNMQVEQLAQLGKRANKVAQD